MTQLRNLSFLLTAAGFIGLAQASTFHLVVPLNQRSAQTPQAPEVISVALSAYTLPSAVVGLPYAGADLRPLLRVTGDPSFNQTGVTWQISAGSLPNGIVLNADGTLSGTPDATGVSTFTATATYKTKSGTQSYDLVVDLPVSLELRTAEGVAATSLNFGNIPVGMASPARSFTLVNSGTAAVKLANPVFKAESPFGVDKHTCGSSLAAGAKCSVSLKFTPTAETTFNNALGVMHQAGEAKLSDLSGAGVPVSVVVTSLTAPQSFPADTYQDISITFQNNTGAVIALRNMHTDYGGGIKYEPQATVFNVPANSTATLTGKLIAGGGSHPLPIYFSADIGGNIVPVTVANVNVSVTQAQAHSAVETFYQGQAQQPEIERINYSGGFYRSGGTSAIGNSSTATVGALAAVKVNVPANAVSPSLMMYGIGRDSSTITVHEDSVTGPVAYRKYFGAYTNIPEAITTSNLQAGKTYYVVPRNNGSYSATLRYLSLRWD